MEKGNMEGLHCCVETCGFAQLLRFVKIFPYVDLFLFDIKDMVP
jgi:pyruvate-formate lyase-activating enzyme